ncbi:uncharacterized protein MELLADRAFT_92621 [Melampsora larici-populina 98AG31]|uniref:Prokaryotic-type class I peptide chain release factors domain-containing protein n=1 Tax=Melampsora larici-populina (strain 98AG31 / pathotype 3-4-7) TaxID=747676 RepID=F4S277_MELLP|nr:uncharacterized protein MELLADRAFT_92621 [Melampsora larici-populina 98AG31]EGG01250.1 hypothetical protein MELLADRAFT_92621 [Melampsora larici-populina 98AG31]
MVSGHSMDGLREAPLEIKGEDVYKRMRWEAGVHCVQCVPVMQNTSLVHTSTAAVIVLAFDPGNQDRQEEALFEDKDVRTETMRSQGVGGQHVNKTESVVRLTHVPNWNSRVFMILRAILSDLRNQQKQVEERGLRLLQLICVFQGRVTDHRIGLTLPRLHYVMEGDETLESIWM